MFYYFMHKGNKLEQKSKKYCPQVKNALLKLAYNTHRQDKFINHLFWQCIYLYST